MGTDAISPGDRLGNVVVGQRIGAGGFGVVYEGLDTVLDRRVAVKVMLERGLGLTERDRARFLREAKAIARLRGTHVAAIYNVHTLAERGWALEMEHVDGGSLAGQLRDSDAPLAESGPRLAPERAVAIASQIAAGLRDAHAHQVVHGDLKPENVLLTSEGTVKLADFGLAHVLGDRRLESTGTVVGTPAYMAPEVIRGEGAGYPSDVWSLGVLLYRMATGRMPFAATSLPALFFAILENAAPPLGPGVPEALANLVLRCLAKDPAARPDSRTELPNQLARIFVSPSAVTRPSDVVPVAIPALPPSIAAPLASGRDDEVAALLAAITAVEAGRGRTVLVTGDVGMGKTTIVRVAEAETRRRGFRWIRVSLDTASGLLRPLLDEFRRSLASDAVSGTTTEFDSEVFGPAAPLLRDMLSAAKPPAFESRQQTVWALQHLLQGLSSQRPVALVVEGVQSADAVEIAILRDLARRLGEHRVLLLMTARVSDAATGSGGTGVLAPFSDVEAMVRIPLRPLGREALYGMLEAALDVRLAPEIARDVVERSGGNPLFALEFVRHMEATGAAVRTASELGTGPSFGKHTLPVRLVDLIAARLRGLPPTQRELLEVAAVDGIDFDGEALAAVVKRPLLTVLRQLQKLARDTGLVVAQPNGFRFEHALLRDVVHDTVAPAYRRELHSALARHLETRPDAIDPERIGVHWEQANEAGRAVVHFRRALAMANERGENGRCVTLGPRAGLSVEALTPETVDECAELILGLARAYTNVGGHEREADALFDRLTRPDGGVRDPLVRMRAAVRCAHNRYFTRGIGGVDEVELNRAIEQLPPSDDLGRAHYLLGVLEKFRGELSRASRRFEAAIAVHARPGGSEAFRASALDQLASVALRSGRAEEATKRYLEAAELSTKGWNKFNAAASEVNAVVASIASARLDGAEARLDRAIRTLQLERSPRLESHARVVRAQLQYARGHTGAAIATLDEVLARPDVQSYLPARIAAQVERGHLAIVRGDAPLADRLLNLAEGSARVQGDAGALLSVVALRCQLACLGADDGLMRNAGLLAVRAVAETREPRGVAVAGTFVAESGLYGLPVEVLDELVSTIRRRGTNDDAFPRLVAFAGGVIAYRKGASTEDSALGASRALALGGLGDRPALFGIVGDFFRSIAPTHSRTEDDSIAALQACASAAVQLEHVLLTRAIAARREARRRGESPVGGA